MNDGEYRVCLNTGFPTRVRFFLQQLCVSLSVSTVRKNH